MKILFTAVMISVSGAVLAVPRLTQANLHNDTIYTDSQVDIQPNPEKGNGGTL